MDNEIEFLSWSGLGPGRNRDRSLGGCLLQYGKYILAGAVPAIPRGIGKPKTWIDLGAGLANAVVFACCAGLSLVNCVRLCQERLTTVQFSAILIETGAWLRFCVSACGYGRSWWLQALEGVSHSFPASNGAFPRAINNLRGISWRTAAPMVFVGGRLY